MAVRLTMDTPRRLIVIALEVLCDLVFHAGNHRLAEWSLRLNDRWGLDEWRREKGRDS